MPREKGPPFSRRLPPPAQGRAAGQEQKDTKGKMQGTPRGKVARPSTGQPSFSRPNLYNLYFKSISIQNFKHPSVPKTGAPPFCAASRWFLLLLGGGASYRQNAPAMPGRVRYLLFIQGKGACSPARPFQEPPRLTGQKPQRRGREMGRPALPTPFLSPAASQEGGALPGGPSF